MKRARFPSALNQGGSHEIADQDVLAGAQLDALLADPGRLGRDGDISIDAQMLQRNAHRHQLGQAGDGQTSVDVLAHQHVAGDGILYQVGARIHLRRAHSGAGGGLNDCERQRKQRRREE